MNEAAKQAFQALVEELLASVKGAKGLLKEQAPEIVKELVRYKTIMTVYDTACTLLVGGAFALGVLFVSSYFPDEFVREDGTLRAGTAAFFKYGTLAADAFFVVIAVLCNMNDYIKLKTAPRLYVLEYVKDLVTSDSSDE